MQISSHADKRCNDGCQFPPHRRPPQGTTENEKTTAGGMVRGRAAMKYGPGKKKVGANLPGGLFFSSGSETWTGTEGSREVWCVNMDKRRDEAQSRSELVIGCSEFSSDEGWKIWRFITWGKRFMICRFPLLYRLLFLFCLLIFLLFFSSILYVTRVVYCLNVTVYCPLWAVLHITASCALASWIIDSSFNSFITFKSRSSWIFCTIGLNKKLSSLRTFRKFWVSYKSMIDWENWSEV